MPDAWMQRMGTIKTYEQDGSAMGRINAWHFAFNLALDRPIVGGGFETFQPDLFLKYAPEPENYHDSHSIYFEDHLIAIVVILEWMIQHQEAREADRPRTDNESGLAHVHESPYVKGSGSGGYYR